MPFRIVHRQPEPVRRSLSETARCSARLSVKQWSSTARWQCVPPVPVTVQRPRKIDPNEARRHRQCVQTHRVEGKLVQHGRFHSRRFFPLPRSVRRADHGNPDLLGVTLVEYTPHQMPYDLRRLRLKGLIYRLPETNRYFVTPYGWKVARLFSRLEARVFRPAMAMFTANDAVLPLPLRQALNRVDAQLDAPSGRYFGLPWRVRDVSRLGACRGQGPAARTDRFQNSGRPWVRSKG